MKHLRLFIVVAFFILLSTILYAGYFKDVPTSHWAYKPAVALSKLGILKGYPDGTFRGEQNVSRYQLAVALYNMVLYLQEYVTDKTKNLVSVSSLYSLRAEISKIADMASKSYKWSSENTKSIQELQKSLASLKVCPESNSSQSPQNINEILSEIISLKTEFDNKLQQFDVKYSSRFDEVQKRLSTLENEVGEVRSLLNRPEKETPDYSEDIKALSRKYNDLNQRLTKLEKNFKSTSSDKNQSLEIDLYSIRKDLVKLQSDYSSLKTKVSNLSDRIDAVEKEIPTKKNYEELKSSYSELEIELKNLKEKILLIQKDMGKLTTSVDEIEKNLNSYRSKNSKAEEEITGEISEIKVQINAVQMKLKALEEKVENIKPKSSNSAVIYSYIFSAVLFIIGIAIAMYL